MTDVESIKYPKDTNKSPMQWDNTQNAGFSTYSSTWFGTVGNGSVLNAEKYQFGIKKILQDAAKLRATENETLLNDDLSNSTIIADGNVLAYTSNSNPKPTILVGT